MSKQMRMVLVLGKYRVSQIEQNQLKSGYMMKVELGGSTTMTIPIPNTCDVRVGDLLTLYTEVLMKASDNAIIIQPPT